MEPISLPSAHTPTDSSTSASPPATFDELLARSVHWRRWLERRFVWRVPDAAAEILAAMWEQCAGGDLDEDRCFSAARVALRRAVRREARFAAASDPALWRPARDADPVPARVIDRVVAGEAVAALDVPPAATPWVAAVTSGRALDRAAVIRGRRWAVRARRTLVARGVDAA